MSGLTREEARKIIDHIRRKNGGITHAARERLRQIDPEVLETIESLRAIVGLLVPTKILAEQVVNSQHTQFIFDLLRNAEQNQYTTALAENEPPFLRFIVYPDKIVIDSNEDGFKEESVRAICQIERSGEKGIGFKSVFKVASKVHIQSGPFSFSFEHAEGDDGLGMVTPTIEEHAELPTDVRTRMTLTLTNSSHARRHMTDFEDLPGTLLLFLTKLKQFEISNRLTESVSSITYNYQYHQTGLRGVLTKKVVSNEGEKVEVSHYRISKKALENLPEDPARSHRRAEVVLAFPVDENATPITRPQHVFAFKPLGTVGFSFLIHSDFIAQANREGLSQSPWNNAIQDGVADSFVDAVVGFCNQLHPTLQYQWLIYLPSKGITDPFWARLLPKIKDRLKVTPVLRTWTSQELRIPAQLKKLTKDCLDQNGRPLFKDLPEEIYLSPSYLVKDWEILTEIGTRIIDNLNGIDLIEADLNDSNSRIRSATIDQDWHTRAAQLILRCLKLASEPNSSPFLVPKIRSFSLIPLKNGEWASASAWQVFFQTLGDTPTPTDLGLFLVDPEVLKNTARKELFSALGVRYPEPTEVITLIHQRYSRYNEVELHSSVAHLRYLYRHMSLSETELDETIYLIDQYGKPVYRKIVALVRDRTIDDLYFESDDEYGVKQLVKPTNNSGSSNIIIAPELQVHFINSNYMEAMPASQTRTDISWKTWLEKFAGVRRVPRLRARKPSSVDDNREMSALFLYIVERRRDKLIGTLKSHWHIYESEMDDAIKTQLKEALVPCKNVEDSSLMTTYLPLPTLISLSKDLGVHGKIPFLQLPSEILDEGVQEWEFLRTFQVGSEPDIDFYLDVLEIFVEEGNSAIPLNTQSKTNLFKVYKEIDRLSMAYTNSFQSIRNVFSNRETIYLPYSNGRTPKWVRPEQCLWAAANALTTENVLASLTDYGGLTHLFQDILHIPNATWEHFMGQLSYYKALPVPSDATKISELYQLLLTRGLGAEEWNAVRDRFESSSLVFVQPQNKWVSPSECLWTERTQISGKYAIKSLYAEHLPFFIAKLGVKKPDIRLFVQELKIRCENFDANNPPIHEVRGLIEDLNELAPQRGDLDELLQCNFLPVRGTDDRLRLKSTAEVFAVADRVEYGQMFQGKLPYLDFSLEEVRVLRKFLTAMGLESRYMSNLAQETSTVNESSKDSVLSEQFQQKASGFYRCAIHFGGFSPEDRSLYQKFLGTEVHESDGISKTVTIWINGVCSCVSGAKGKIHIAEIAGQLRLCVPKDPRDRELCYLVQLPEKLASYLGITDAAATKVFGDLLKASPVLVEDVLTDHGIVQIPGLLDATSIDNLTQETSALTLANKAAPIGKDSELDVATVREAIGLSNHAITEVSDDATTFTPSQRTTTPSQETLDTNRDYRDLLDRIIAAARTHRIPAKNHELDSASTSSPIALPENIFGVRSENRFGHDSKMGVVGELYVFELLLNMNLPNFGRENWQSRSREYVCIHDRYADMKPWNERETADIIYEDLESRLTRRLIDLGYLPNRWQGRRPKYYLEVKTTTGKCERLFCMNSDQCQLMQEMSNAINEIYVILRVFDLGQKRTGLRIYLDPESMRKTGELQFTKVTDRKYTIVPGVPNQYDIPPRNNDRSPIPAETSSGRDAQGADALTRSRDQLSREFEASITLLRELGTHRGTSVVDSARASAGLPISQPAVHSSLNTAERTGSAWGKTSTTTQENKSSSGFLETNLHQAISMFANNTPQNSQSTLPPSGQASVFTQKAAVEAPPVAVGSVPQSQPFFSNPPTPSPSSRTGLFSGTGNNGSVILGGIKPDTSVSASSETSAFPSPARPPLFGQTNNTQQAASSSQAGSGFFGTVQPDSTFRFSGATSKLPIVGLKGFLDTHASPAVSTSPSGPGIFGSSEPPQPTVGSASPSTTPSAQSTSESNAAPSSTATLAVPGPFTFQKVSQSGLFASPWETPLAQPTPPKPSVGTVTSPTPTASEPVFNTFNRTDQQPTTPKFSFGTPSDQPTPTPVFKLSPHSSSSNPQSGIFGSGSTQAPTFGSKLGFGAFLAHETPIPGTTTNSASHPANTFASFGSTTSYSQSRNSGSLFTHLPTEPNLTSNNKDDTQKSPFQFGSTSPLVSTSNLQPAHPDQASGANASTASSAPSAGLGIFGRTTAQPTSPASPKPFGSLFSLPPAQPNPVPTGLLSTPLTTTASGVASSGSLFGSSGSLFQSSSTTASGIASSGSLFGSSGTTSSHTLFGSSGATSSHTLFGSSAAASSRPLFDSSGATSSHSVFGSSAAASSRPPFGSSGATSSHTLFGSSAAASSRPLFSSSGTTSSHSLFGSSGATSSHSVPGSSAAASSRPPFGSSGATSSHSLFGSSAAASSHPRFGSSGSLFDSLPPPRSQSTSDDKGKDTEPALQSGNMVPAPDNGDSTNQRFFQNRGSTVAAPFVLPERPFSAPPNNLIAKRKVKVKLPDKSSYLTRDSASVQTEAKEVKEEGDEQEEEEDEQEEEKDEQEEEEDEQDEEEDE
ncbi:MAG: hypothetical protein MMC33_004916 [Icmadophila ericetorum]|nr:hypothetical protein [Icmadophila ericetorum]